MEVAIEKHSCNIFKSRIDHINIVSYDDTLLDYSKGSIAQGSLDTVYGTVTKWQPYLIEQFLAHR